MKFRKIAALFGLGILGSVAIADLAKAGQFDVVHKWTDSVAGKTYVFIPAQTAGSPVTGLTSPKNPTLKVLTLNNCGIGKVSKGTTSPVTSITGAGGATVNFSEKTTGAEPTCTAGTTPGTYTSSWAGAVGDVLDAGTYFYIKGGTGIGALSVNVTTTGTITSKANACGFLRTTVSATRPMTNFNVGATAYTLAALPSVTNPMICKKVGVNSFTYIPAP
jgi:hypothetical protein